MKNKAVCVHESTFGKACRDQTLQQKAALYFGEKPTEHIWNEVVIGEIVRCAKCDTIWVDDNSPCPIPDKVDINDMGLAMKAFRSVEIPFRCMRDVYNQDNGHSQDPTVLVVMPWILRKATPPQLFEIAIRAMESKN